MRIDFLFEDARAAAAAERLCEGFDVRLAVPLEKALSKENSTIVLPIPLSRDGELATPPLSMPLSDLGEILRTASPHTLTVGYGQRPDALFGVRYADLESVDSYVEKNAALTAEGGMAMLLDYMKAIGRSLENCTAVILGYGRIARHMAARLSPFGVDILIGARKKEARQAAEERGFHAFDIADPHFFSERGKWLFGKKSHILINTVPDTTPLLHASRMPHPLCGLELSGKAPVLQEMTALLSPTLDGRALPLRYAPLSAGHALADAIRALIAGR